MEKKSDRSSAGRQCTSLSGTPTVLPNVPFSTQNLSEYVRILASDEFEGRAPASDGEAKTIAYLSHQFGKVGAQPAGDGGSWTQEVPLRKLELTPEASLRISVGADTSQLINGNDVVFNSLANVEDFEIQDAPIVFVGYGINAPQLDWDDFKTVDLKGKVAIILINDPDFESPNPGKFGGKAMSYYGRWTYKFKEAGRRGAAAALIIHEDEPASYKWTTVQSSWGGGVQFDIARPEPQDPPPLIQGWLRRDVADALLRRAGLHLSELKKLAMRPDFMPVDLRGVRLSVQAHLHITPIVSHNVIAKRPGTERANECVIYSAHWDHLGIGTPDQTGDRIYHGAIDNATAVAGLLELARVFTSAPPTARSIYFIAFTAEEKGLLGSEYYASQPANRLEHTVAVFNMELLGVTGPACDLSTWGNVRSELNDCLSVAAAAQGRLLAPDRHLEAGYFYRSDHFSFAKRGVPAVTIMSGQNLYQGSMEAGKKAYEDYIAHRYHQPADRWTPDLDLRGAAIDLDVLYRAGRELANSTAWPSWDNGAEFKDIRDQTSDARA